MKRFTVAGILQLLSCISPAILLELALRRDFETGDIAGTTFGIIGVLALIVLSSIFCFVATRKESMRLPATVCCGIVCVPSTLITLLLVAALVKEFVAPSSGFFGPEFYIHIILVLLAFTTPTAICSTISFVLGIKGTRA